MIRTQTSFQLKVRHAGITYFISTEMPMRNAAGQDSAAFHEKLQFGLEVRQVFFTFLLGISAARRRRRLTSQRIGNLIQTKHVIVLIRQI